MSMRICGDTLYSISGINHFCLPSLSQLLSFVDFSLLILCLKFIHFYFNFCCYFSFDYFGFSFLMCKLCLLTSEFSYFLIYASSDINLTLNHAFTNPMTLILEDYSGEILPGFWEVHLQTHFKPIFQQFQT